MLGNKVHPIHFGYYYKRYSDQSLTCLYFQTHEQLWLEIAEKVTMCVQQIIEFAKMVPGFMSLLQDDQIMLLKGTNIDNISARCFSMRLHTWPFQGPSCSRHCLEQLI